MSLPSGVGSPTARWLFSQHFLEDRLPTWPELASLDVTALHERLRELWQRESPTLVGANEGETEERLIRPVLRELGHSFQLFLEIPGAGKTPDYFLYASEAERASAERLEPQARIERSIAVADAKRFDLLLDRRTPQGDPVAQLRDYMLLSQRPFGILTNGRVWRLYARESALVERSCHEVDLGTLLEEGSHQDLRYFVAFFGPQAFVPGVDGRTFLERALDDSHLHAVEVSDRLERAIFAALPAIATGLLGDEPRTRATLESAFAGALVFLYRTLFCLFAEARGLLPLGNPDYRRYSITEHRLEVVRLSDQGDVNRLPMPTTTSPPTSSSSPGCRSGFPSRRPTQRSWRHSAAVCTGTRPQQRRSVARSSAGSPPRRVSRTPASYGGRRSRRTSSPPRRRSSLRSCACTRPSIRASARRVS